MAAWTASEWSAVASSVTALAVVIASFFGLRQVREVRRLREEQAQPYVVVYMEPSAASPQIVDLVVRNFGATVAYNVQVKMTPPPRRTVPRGEEDLRLFDSLPNLVPGQEWRTLWDFAPSRAGSDLPDRYECVVSYEDLKGRSLPHFRYVLDWSVHRGREFVTTYTLHDAAKALREINSKLSRWQEATGGGLKVWVRDGDAKDEQLREVWEAHRKRPEQLPGEQERPEEIERPSDDELTTDRDVDEDET
jgi:hypothetical protein